MGFRYEPRQYKLVFEDSELSGLEVITNSVTLAEYNAVRDDESLGKLFSKKLISWNLEDKDGSVPATYEGLEKQEISLVKELLARWFAELTGVSDPLARNSSDSQRSVEESLAMDTSSLSPQS
jgi:hypothetical protein